MKIINSLANIPSLLANGRLVYSMSLLRITSLLSVMLFFTACYYDSEEELYPGTSGGNCDTTNVTFAGTIQPILASNCNSCHNSATQNGNVITDNYNSLIVHVNSGIFRKAINHETGAAKMPQNAPKLPACELAKIDAWINQGAPNN